HKMVLFPLDQVPEMARGRGVRLQKYSSAKLSDVAVFELKAGLTWKDSAGREQSMSAKDLSQWRGNRADAGRIAGGLPPGPIPRSIDWARPQTLLARLPPGAVGPASRPGRRPRLPVHRSLLTVI